MERKTREKKKEKKRVEEISQDERKKIREEQRLDVDTITLVIQIFSIYQLILLESNPF